MGDTVQQVHEPHVADSLPTIKNLKGFHCDLYNELLARIDHHINICERQISKFSRWALFIRYSLPILTAIASGIAGLLAGAYGKGVASHEVAGPWLARAAFLVALVSFLASIISALNAAMKPAIQYGHYVRYINRFWTQRFALQSELEKTLLATGNDEHQLRERLWSIVSERSQALDKVIEAFSEESVSNIGIPPAEKEQRA